MRWQSRPISRILCTRHTRKRDARGSHSSSRAITDALKLPTRRRDGGPVLHLEDARLPTWNCSGWRLPCRSASQQPRCALTAPFHPYLIPWLAPGAIGGLLSVALFRVSPRMAVSHHPAWWSPDFPRPLRPKPEKPRLPGLLCSTDFSMGVAQPRRQAHCAG